jgi:hypothetical protein
VIALAILALSLSLQVEIQPVGFKAVNISGGPNTGYYDIFLALSGIEVTQTTLIPIQIDLE